MEKNDVALIAEQFGITPEIVESSVKDGTLGVRIKDKLAEKVIYDKPAFETFQKNLKAETVTAYYAELEEKSKLGDVPQGLYKNIKGSVLQQKERELSKKTGIETYKDIDDLIDQAVKTSANGKQHPELVKQIDELKTQNLKLLEEKTNAVKTVEQEYKSKFLTTEMNSILNQFPLDLTDIKAEDLATVKEKRLTMLRSVFNNEYKLDTDAQNRTVVLKGTDVLKNQATLEPQPLNDVLKNLADVFGIKTISRDPGGHGGQTSSKDTGVKFQTNQDFYDYCAANKIDVTSQEAMKLLRERLVK
jgi:hypothetical protein